MWKAFFLAICAAAACTSSSKKISQAMDTDLAIKHSDEPANGRHEVTAPLELEVVKPPCLPLNAAVKNIPYYVPNQNLVMTRLSNVCETPSGLGYEKGAAWMAMGFPCTGSGVVETKGRFYANPNMVVFILNTGCQMVPGDRTSVSQLATEHIGIGGDVNLIAYYPFATQFWELVDFPGTGIGSDIELRSTSGLRHGWKALINQGKISVRLYGREDSWAQNKDFYKVDGEISLVSRKRFRLKVLQVHVMNAQEVDEVKKRCQTVRPSINCDGIFIDG